jgi:hypothetical protein
VSEPRFNILDTIEIAGLCLAVIGLALIPLGVGLWSLPAGLVVAGVEAIGIGALLIWAGNGGLIGVRQ